MHSKDTKRRRVLLGLMVFLVTIFIISFAGTVHFSAISLGVSSHDAMAAETTETASGAPPSFADLAEKLKPAVVNISTTKTITTGGFRSPLNDPRLDRFFGGDDFLKSFSVICRGENSSREAWGPVLSSARTDISLRIIM